ncbi:MAG: GntR family transcriptional regulator [Kiritimatiellia bacterium]
MKLRPRMQRFEKVKSALVNSILEGEFKPGDMLPSLRDLCAHFDFSLATVQRAVRELKAQEWLISLPQKGIMVADPLPPMAHLMRLKKKRMAGGAAPMAARASNGLNLKCLIFDEALLPLFEWSAREYTKDYAPCRLQFEVRPLPGRDDIEAMQNLNADLILIPTYVVNYGVNLNALTSVDEILPEAAGFFNDISPEIIRLIEYRGRKWGMPVMMEGPVLVADEKKCARAGIDWKKAIDINSLVALLEKAVECCGGRKEAGLLFNLAFPYVLSMAAGFDYPGISYLLEMTGRADFRSFLERLRKLASSPLVAVNRFDQWDRADLTKMAVRHQPSGLFCRDKERHEGARVLPIPGPGAGRVSMPAISMCVSARSVHVFEAWEWAARLGGAQFQARLAEMGYNIPASLNPQVRKAFEKVLGAENARVLQDLACRPSRVHGIWEEDVRRYHWEIFGNELYRFIAGINDYDRMLERLKTKTRRFLPYAKFSVLY